MIKTTVEADGFEGIFFPVSEKKDKVVIVVSGANGGMSLTKKCAEFYHKNGIAALAVACLEHCHVLLHVFHHISSARA